MADADVTAYELRARFSRDVADPVEAVTDDEACIGSYREREQCFAIRSVPRMATRRCCSPQTRAHNRLEHCHEMRLEHLRESLGMLERVAARHPLVKRLADDLAACPFPARAEGGRLT